MNSPVRAELFRTPLLFTISLNDLKVNSLCTTISTVYCKNPNNSPDGSKYKQKNTSVEDFQLNHVLVRADAFSCCCLDWI